MKTTMKRIPALVLAAALGSSFTFSGFAEARPDEDKNRPRHELSQEQKASARKIMEENRDASSALKKTLESQRSEYDALLKSENPDKARIISLSREIGETRGKIAISRLELKAELKKAGLPENLDMKDLREGKYRGKMAEIMGNLTPEQQAAAQKIYEERRAGDAQIKQSLDAKRAELDATIKSGNPDKAKIETLSGEIGALRGKMLANHLETREKLKKAGLPEELFEKGGKARDVRKETPKGERNDRYGKKDDRRDQQY